jgi:hypothetical protein
MGRFDTIFVYIMHFLLSRTENALLGFKFCSNFQFFHLSLQTIRKPYCHTKLKQIVLDVFFFSISNNDGNLISIDSRSLDHYVVIFLAWRRRSLTLTRLKGFD